MLVDTVITAYIWILVIAALLSWVSPNPFNPLVQIIYKITAPAYMLIRKLRIPTVFGGIDIAPIILIFGLEIIKFIILRILNEIAYSL